MGVSHISLHKATAGALGSFGHFHTTNLCLSNPGQGINLKTSVSLQKNSSHGPILLLIDHFTVLHPEKMKMIKNGEYRSNGQKKKGNTPRIFEASKEKQAPQGMNRGRSMQKWTAKEAQRPVASACSAGLKTQVQSLGREHL